MPKDPSMRYALLLLTLCGLGSGSLAAQGISHDITCSPGPAGVFIDLSITGGQPLGTYVLVTAFATAGTAGSGWFLGISPTLAELNVAFSTPGFVGGLTPAGTFDLRIPVVGVPPVCGTGLLFFDAVVVEMSAAGTFVSSSMPVTHRL